MNLSSPFIKRPVMTTFFMIALVIAGVAGFLRLPVSDLPNVERPHVNVITTFAGASSTTMLHQVTIPLEKELMHVKGLKEISSGSVLGKSVIDLTFSLEQDMDQVIREIQAALSHAQGILPKEIDAPPRFHLQNEGSEPIMYLLMTGIGKEPKELYQYAENFVTPRLERIDGVANVIAYGQEKAIYVRLNPELLTARGLGFDQILQTIELNSRKVPLGTIQSSSKSLSIELAGQLQEMRDIANLKIVNSDLRIKDVAEVSDKSDKEVKFRFIDEGKSIPAVVIAIQKVSDGNTVSISNHIKEVLLSLEKELPIGVKVSPWFDKAVWIEESLVEVEWSLLFAFVLVALVVYLSLGRFLESVIISVALPLSLLGTFAIIYPLGFSLNLLSLLALTLSLGFVVDDAIVVLENIVRNKEKGMGVMESALQGSKQISFTVLSMTLSLIAVFIPLLFMEGMNGRLFGEFSITLSVAILVSGVVSLTVTPMLCSKFLKPHHIEASLEAKIALVNAKAVNFYAKSLKKCLQYKKSLWLITFAIVVATVPLFNQLTVNLVPQEDRGVAIAFIQMPQGLSNDEIDTIQNRLDTLLNEENEVHNFVDILFGKNIVFIVHLKEGIVRRPMEQFVKDLQKKFETVPGIQPFVRGYQLINLDMDMGAGGQYEMLVRGHDLKEVKATSEKIALSLQKDPLVAFAKSSMKNDSPKLVVEVNEEQSLQIGLSSPNVQSILQKAFGKTYAGSIQKGAFEENIYIDLQTAYKKEANALSKISLSNNEGIPIPLKTIATWREELDAPQFERNEMLPSAKVMFMLKEASNANVAINHLEKLAQSSTKEGLFAELYGGAKMVSQALNSTLFLLFAAIIVMYIVLGILYESFIHPLTILSSLPIACLGGILTLLVFNEPLSIFSSVGFLLLIGIVKKNGIMMVDYALEAKEGGLSAQEAIIEAATSRFRPIMMTTFAAVMGAVPIALGFGESSGTRQGLGLVIVGGLLFAQVLTLYITPLIYLTFDRLTSKREVTLEGLPVNS